MIPPRKVRNEPEYIQKMYIREFERVEGQTGSVLAGRQAADRLLYLLKARLEDNPKEEHVLVTMIARITEMDAIHVLPQSILDKIKEMDAHPFFAVYDIGESGVSTGDATKSNKTITKRKLWSFKAIKELAIKIKEGAASVIVGHDSDVIVGTVVHAFNKVINKTLHALAVVHITSPEVISQVKTKELDVCSVEGNVTLARNSKENPWYVKTVEWINRLALGNSTISKPGFSSASILATIQELERKGN